MQLNRLARDTVEKLLAETGHTLTAGDFAQVFTLNALADRISHPHHAEDIDLVEMPRAVGGVVLRPLSLGAWQWLDKFALPTLGGHWLADIAVAYAMANSHQPAVLRDSVVGRDLRRLI